MIHSENGTLEMNGKPAALVEEATGILKDAIAGYYAVAKKVTNVATARKLTKKLMKLSFRVVRKGAFEEVEGAKIEG